MIYKLEIEMRPQHLEDVALWCVIKNMGGADRLLHNFTDQVLKAILESKAVPPKKWEQLKQILDEEIEQKFNPMKHLE